jgi:hypothetical protein
MRKAFGLGFLMDIVILSGGLTAREELLRRCVIPASAIAKACGPFDFAQGGLLSLPPAFSSS